MDLFKLVGRIAIMNEEANTAIDETTKKAKDLKDQFDGVGSSTDTMSDKMGSSGKFNAAAVWLGSTLATLTEKTVKLGFNLAKIGFDFNATLETYEVQFGTLLGDAERAAQFMSELREFDKATPLELDGLAKTSVMLLQMGNDVDSIIPKLEMLGNLSMGDPRRMESVVRAYTQIASKGGLMAQEMYQLGDAMVPIVQIMTKYGGERYADGSWYQKKMTDPTFKIPFEDLDRAFQNAVASGGEYYDVIYAMMDTYNGQMDLLEEQGKQTLGALMEPFFEMAKSEVIPNLIASLEKFQTWVENNKETLDKLATTLGDLVATGFDKFLNLLQWVLDNGDATKGILMGIATALYLGAVAAHPYATAIATITAGLAALNAYENRGENGGIFKKYSKEDLDTLNEYAAAMRAVKEAEKEKIASGFAEDKEKAWKDAIDAANTAARKVNEVNGLMGDYWAYLKKHMGDDGEYIYIDVTPELAEGSTDAIQGELTNANFNSTVTIYADMGPAYEAVNNANFQSQIGVSTVGGTVSVNGSHASGLDRVPFDGYIARLHKDETILNSTNAAIWRSGGVSRANFGRLESGINRLIGLTERLVSNGSGSPQIILDSGVLVGQIAPQMDARLGTISARRGRRG